MCPRPPKKISCRASSPLGSSNFQVMRDTASQPPNLSSGEARHRSSCLCLQQRGDLWAQTLPCPLATGDQAPCGSEPTREPLGKGLGQGWAIIFYKGPHEKLELCPYFHIFRLSFTPFYCRHFHIFRPPLIVFPLLDPYIHFSSSLDCLPVSKMGAWEIMAMVVGFIVLNVKAVVLILIDVYHIVFPPEEKEIHGQLVLVSVVWGLYFACPLGVSVQEGLRSGLVFKA